MGRCTWMERYVGDLDDVFAYRSMRTVRIRDRRLGFLFYTIELAIALYVGVYQIGLRQQYMKEFDVIGSARMQLLRPSNSYRWPDGNAPYCTNSTLMNNQVPYFYPADGYYQYKTNGVIAPQGTCAFIDANMSVPDPLENDAIFLTTRTSVSSQSVTPSAGGQCDFSQHEYCDWNTTSSDVYYTGDAEMFTLLIDHVMAAPKMDMTRTVSQMSGSITNFNGDNINPCDAYVGYAGGCPSYIGVGIQGSKDIIAIRTLLQAAGIASLDQVAGTDDSLSNETLRYSGMIIVINIEYTNFLEDTGSANSSDVRYFYRVSAVKNAEYKAEAASLTNDAFLGPSRTVINRHGVRIVVSFSGNVGAFDFQTLLINVTVSLGLLSVAVVVMDALALYCCPLRFVYSQYKERATVDFSDLRKTDQESLQSVLQRFRQEPHLVDPVPEVFETLMGRDKAWRRGGMATDNGGDGSGIGGSGNSSSRNMLSALMMGTSGRRGGGGGVGGSGSGSSSTNLSGSLSPSPTTALIVSTAASASSSSGAGAVPNPLNISSAAGGLGGTASPSGGMLQGKFPDWGRK